MNALAFRRYNFHKHIHLRTYFNRIYSTHSKNIRVISFQHETYPRTVKKYFPANFIKRKPVKKPVILESETEHRVNEVNMQMLSRNIFSQVFKSYNSNVPADDLIECCLQDLATHGMKTNNAVDMPEIELKLPPLEGENLEEHFKIIGERQCGPYKQLVNELILDIPPVPKNWVFTTGWTRYAPGCKPEPVAYPLENAVVFDVEVTVRYGPIPTLATAVSNKAWYGWISHSLIDATDKPLANQHFTLDDFIPMESTPCNKGYNLGSDLKKPKIVVGHNVSYDRAKIKEQYWFEQTGLRFVDTMSLHVCVSGITSYQRAVLKSGKQNLDEDDDKWKLCSSLNNLSEVHNLYCGSLIDKQTRDVFVEGTLVDVKEQFQEVMQYCASDVVATHNVLRVLFPMFLDRFPHPVTFSGMLEVGLAYLPVNSNWNRYISDCQQTYDDLDNEAKFLLAKRADNACQMMEDEKYKKDLWMWDQDWSTQELKLKKTVSKSVRLGVKVNEILPKNDETELESNKSHAKVSESANSIAKNNYKRSKSTKLIFKDNEGIQEGTKVETRDDDVELDTLEEKFKVLMNTKYLLPVKKPLLPGYPLWYRKLCTKPDSEPNWVPGPHQISTSMQVTPKLLCLTWEGYPLHYIREKGWGFLVPHSENTEDKRIPMKQLLEKCPVVTLKSNQGDMSSIGDNLHKEVEKNLSQKEYWRSKKGKDKTDGLYKGSGVWCNTDLEDCCWFMKLPHKNGVSFNVGNPLARDFLNKFSDNVLAGDSEIAEKVLSIARMLSYWRNNRDRIMQQMIVWLKENEIAKPLRREGSQFGAIIPQIVVCGTLTRRAMEPTWMTASNAQRERVGSELRSMVQAPPGYSMVGADVDSQELWIASVIGDAHHAKMHGATPLGWMTLIGTKSNGTDMHSVTAKAVGISRDHAKVINYARIYGAGQNFAERLLKQFNPSMTEGEARSKAMKMFALTKGKRVFRLKEEYLEDFVDKPYSSYQAFELAKVHGKRMEDLFQKPKWVGGSESAMFNRLEEIAGSASPVTPFLHGRLSRALEPKNMPDDRFLPTRVNWVVQSGAVDFLHLMLVCMRWLLQDNARFCLSFHDEVRYLVPDNLKYDAALAMHITNLLTRAFCSIKLGIYDLPQSVAFFSSVEVDTVLRKESHLDSKTPSNPHGLEKGYGIPNGESLSIQECIKKTGGSISLWREKSR